MNFQEESLSLPPMQLVVSSFSENSIFCRTNTGTVGPDVVAKDEKEKVVETWIIGFMQNRNDIFIVNNLAIILQQGFDLETWFTFIDYLSRLTHVLQLSRQCQQSP